MTGGPAAPDYEARKREEIGYFRYLGERLKMPAIQGYWAERFLRPKLQAVGLDSLRTFHQHSVGHLCEQSPTELVEVASLGSGFCQHEIRIATQLRARGITNFRIDCVDLSGHALARARQSAEKADVVENLGFVVTDIRDWNVSERNYAACLAIHSLHHFVELETVFAKVREALAPGGLFVVNDMIGRNGHRRWPEALPYVEEIWRELPDRYKYHHLLKRVDPEYVDRDWSQTSFEGIRAQDILPLLMQFFHFELFVAVRNVIDPFLSPGYGPNFNVRRKEDRAFIRRVARLDDRLIDEGVVKPTRLIAWLRAEPVSTRCYRHWTPEHCVRQPDDATGPEQLAVPNGVGAAGR